MSEIAEMMLDGTLCERCGGIIDGTTPGFPRLCEDCEDDDLDEEIESLKYEFNFNKMAIEKLVQQIIEYGTIKQKKAILKTLYKCIGKVKNATKN